MVLDLCFHGLFCRLVDLRHHRDSDQEGPRPNRHPVRAAGRDTDPDRLADPPHPGDLGRSIWWPRRLHRHHAQRCGHDRASDLRIRLPDILTRGTRRRHRRRLVFGRRCLCLQVVPKGQARNRARHLWCGQRRGGGHETRRTRHHGGLRLEIGRADLGGSTGNHWRLVLPFHEGRSRSRAPTRDGGEARAAVGDAGAAQEHPGLALLALLFLRVRWLRRAVAVAAALPDGRLQPRHQDSRHDRRCLLHPGFRLPRLWRAPVRQIRRAACDVLDVLRLRRRHLHPVLPADAIHGAGHSRPDDILDVDEHRRLHGSGISARLLHEPRQSCGL